MDRKRYFPRRARKLPPGTRRPACGTPQPLVVCITLLLELYLPLCPFFLPPQSASSTERIASFSRRDRNERSRGRRFTPLYTALRYTAWPIHEETDNPFCASTERELSPRGEAGARLPARSTSFPHDVCFLASRYEGKMFLSRGR